MVTGMVTKRVSSEQRARLDDLHRLVFDELCRRYPDEWVLDDAVSPSAGRGQKVGKRRPGP
jgi:hypothetical protein